MIRHLWLRLGLFAPLALALVACGAQNQPPTPGQAATTTLTGAYAGSVTLTPIHSTHVVVYYRNQLIPYANATTPVVLRQNSCDGPAIANLTAATAATPSGALAAVVPTGAKGVNVAAGLDQTTFVVVLAHANDAGAPQLACGSPVDANRQFFSLFTPGQGTNGPQLGLALSDPELATRVKASLTIPAPTALDWDVYNGACAGAPLGHGQIAAGATTGAGVIFQSAPATGWSLALTPAEAASATTPLVCQQMHG